MVVPIRTLGVIEGRLVWRQNPCLLENGDDFSSDSPPFWIDGRSDANPNSRSPLMLQGFNTPPRPLLEDLDECRIVYDSTWIVYDSTDRPSVEWTVEDKTGR
jgi:hypothetical protein